MIARFANFDDIQTAERFFSQYRDEDQEADRPTIAQRVRESIALKSTIAVDLGGEVIGGMVGVFLSPFTETKKIFFVYFFFITKSARKYIRKFFAVVLELLKGHAQAIIIASPFSDQSKKRDRFYRIMGFRPTETHFIKAI